MNKEHFLIELKICLKPIASEEQVIILEQYEMIFNERIAAGETEEQIAKSLGKPRDIANEILREHNISIPKRKIADNGWREVTPEFLSMDDNFEAPEPLSRERRPFIRFLQITGIILLNAFLMFWVILAVIFGLFGSALVNGVTLLAPVLGIYGVLVQWNDGTLFQLFVSIGLFGASIIGWLILVPLTKICWNVFRYYFRWNIAVLRGEN